ncbi:GMC oxidoreductase [Streptomyces sp. NBC_01390]|uniref:GMC oxidoreductase n=1 Tax=Streptomyces sp. NBC_01390 TaxID=2903850 RepID=UPI003256366F
MIGSGFGGAVAALRLGQAGVQTLVLERGRHWTYSPTQQVFGNEQNPMSQMFWQNDFAIWLTMQPTLIDRMPGLMEVVTAGGIQIGTAACVGGGSVVYAGVTVQPRRRHFEALFPAGVSYTELDQVHFPRVRQMLSASYMPEDIYRTDPFTHSRAFDAQLKRAGFPTQPIRTTFNWSRVRGELAGRLRPSSVIGESSFGNSNGAKHDLTQNYLPAALATGNVRISQLTEVTSIAVGPGGRGYTVRIREHAPDGGIVATRELGCDMLFLAAGSVNTTRLLVRARDTGELSELNEHVGTCWGGNGDAFVYRAFEGPTGASQGAPCASAVFVEDGFGMPLRIENWYALAFGGEPYLSQFSVAVDMDNRGTWTYDKATDEVKMLDWGPEKNLGPEAAAAAFSNTIIGRGVAGPSPILPPTGGTAHPLGGCPLGRATDLYGRVEGYRDLYALDGSLVPGNAGGANPSLLITALAERAMDDIVAHSG